MIMTWFNNKDYEWFTTPKPSQPLDVKVELVSDGIDDFILKMMEVLLRRDGVSAKEASEITLRLVCVAFQISVVSDEPEIPQPTPRAY